MGGDLHELLGDPLLSFAELVAKSVKSLPKPGREAATEAGGFMLLAVGLLMMLAVFTFNPSDYGVAADITNMGGPFGAWLAGQILGFLGVTGIVLPVIVIVWGLLLALGFVVLPPAHRVIGFMVALFLTAAFIQVQLSVTNVMEPSFGFGGHIGAAIGKPLLRGAGYGGATLLIGGLFFASLVMSGNLSLVSLRHRLSYVTYLGHKLVAYIKQKQSENQTKTPEQMIREVLAEEAKKSRRVERIQGMFEEESAAVSAQPISQAKKTKKTKRKKIDLSEMDDELDELTEDVIDLINDAEEIDPAQAAEADAQALEFYYKGPSHGKPKASMFKKSSAAKNRSKEFEAMAEKLTAQLKEFKVDGRVKKIVEGPVVTTFEFEPVPGTKVSKITGLSADLARLLQAKSLRILAPIPGKKVIGFEVPNAERRMIGFADFAEHRKLKSQKTLLPIGMGMDAFGKPVIEDLAKMPHLLVAGSTGSGKSVFMNTLIASLVCRHSAKDLRFVMIDPKMVELAVYNDLPHMACPVVSDPSTEAKAKLDALVVEMENRFKLMQMLGARNIESYNETIRNKRKSQFPKFTDKWQTMPFIVLIVDELADMMMVLGKEVEVPITRLAQKARAAGIHLVIATQRPSAEVVTGLIKANFPTRVAFRVLSGLDSRTIIDQSGAEGLIGQGDMLFLNSAGVTRMHGAYLDDNEVSKMVKSVGKK